MALANLVFQRQAFTYASVVSSFAHRAMARLNLHPSAWPEPAARTRFLADADPQILSGHPTSLAELIDASHWLAGVMGWFIMRDARGASGAVQAPADQALDAQGRVVDRDGMAFQGQAASSCVLASADQRDA